MPLVVSLRADMEFVTELALEQRQAIIEARNELLDIIAVRSEHSVDA